LFNWLRENPHRLNLALIGLLLDDRPPSLDQVTAINQKLDLWSGTLDSGFRLGLGIGRTAQDQDDEAGEGATGTRTNARPGFLSRALLVHGRGRSRSGQTPRGLHFSAGESGDHGSFLGGESSAELPVFAEVREASAGHWKRFWSTGGAIDLSVSDDRRARELERRIVLSQYLTAIHAQDPRRLRRPDSRATVGTANSTWKCTGGMPLTSLCGAYSAARA
jgi:hypothetical protein